MSKLLKRLILTAFTLFAVTFISSSAYAQQNFEITDPTLLTPQEYRISSITVEGNSTTRTEFVVNASTLFEGKRITYPGEDLAEALRRLYRVGLFSDVQILITSRSAGQISLLIRVTEQPTLVRYRLEGIKRSERRDLEDLITLTPGVAITDANKSQSINTIRRFYRGKGHWDTQVTTRVEMAEDLDNRATLIFDIDPGERLEIKRIEFVGNDSFSDKKLRKQLKPLKLDKWWKFLSKKVYKETDFEEGQDNLLAYYRKNGFSDARIISDTVYTYNYVKDLDGVAVRLTVEEGPQYKVRNITWDGNTVYTDEQLTTALDFEKGDVFNEEKFDMNTNINQSETDISSLHQNIGYLFFRLDPQITRVAEDSIDIHFDIYEDEIATISEVSFAGNTKTHDDVVRRTLRTIPGNTYSRSAIIRTVRELGTLGYFDAQSIDPQVIPDRGDKTVDITYLIKESASTDNFEFSGGYGGRTIGAIVSARVNFNNFSIQRAFEKGGWTPIPSGDGQKLSLGVQVTGQGYQSYSMSFSEPWLGGKPTAFGVNFSYNLLRYSFSDERNELFSGSVYLGKRLKWPDDYFSMRTSLGYQLYDVDGNSSYLPSGITNTLTIEQSFERNSLDNLISPYTGSKFNLSGEIGIPLPGFSEYYKIKTGFQYHFPLAGKLVMTAQADFGYIGYLTENRRSEFQRFLLGGTQLQQRQSFLYDNITMRGYPGGTPSQSIAPIVNGEKVAGRLFNRYSLEMRYPAVTSDQVQVIPYTFFDAGNTYSRFSTYDPFQLKRAAGFGARLYLPILGLIDLSYGYRFDGVNGPTSSSSLNPGEWEFLFNIGAPF